MSHSTPDPQATAFWKLRKEQKPCIKPANNGLVLEEWVWPVRKPRLKCNGAILGAKPWDRTTCKDHNKENRLRLLWVFCVFVCGCFFWGGG